MAYNDVMHKTELAAQAVGATIATAQSLSSFVGLEDDPKALPSVSYVAESAEPMLAGQLYGNRFITLAIVLRTNADDTTAAQHRAKAEALFDVFLDDTLPALLSAGLADFTCLTAAYLGETQNTIDRSYQTSLRLRLLVAPSDVT